MNGSATVLETSWRRGWRDVGVAAADAALLQRLLDAWREPQRRYHTLQHLAECIAAFGPVRSLARAPGEVELALWFHDAVYDVRRHDNEARSADWARAALAGAGAAAEVAGRVHGLVMATRHAAPAGTPDAMLLVDIDLSILGAPAERFAQYEAQVRDEYAWVDDATFRLRRREVLTGFLARPTIYATDPFHSRLEAAARANLERSIRQLEDPS
jgi:predicted metal-dependent HD superfamily phosphohydrolase